MKSSVNEDQAKYLYKIAGTSSHVTLKTSQKVRSNSPKISESPTKIAKDFIHSGLGYSPGRRGMLVVDNNAVGISLIPCNPYQIGQKMKTSKSQLFSTGFNYNSTSNLQ